jgi:phosphoribosylanthranilate isomerase
VIFLFTAFHSLHVPIVMTKVKICGITNLKDALVAIDAGAFALGFNFYSRSPRYIDPTAARNIVDALPEGVMCVGVFVNESKPETVAQVADQAGVAAIQLHGDESTEYCRAFQDRFIIKALRVDSNFTPERAIEFKTQAILLDAFSPVAFGGTGHTVDWSLAQKTRALIPKLFLAGGLTPENVGEAISVVRPYAVDACSCLESSPGQKDATLTRAFVANALNAC